MRAYTAISKGDILFYEGIFYEGIYCYIKGGYIIL